MRWVNWVSKNSLRGWNASAPADAGSWLGVTRGINFGLAARISSSGKSSICPDQVSWVFANAGFVFGPEICGNGMAINAMCQSAAAKIARRGRTAFDPDISEKTCREKIPGEAGAAEQLREIAGDALVELSQRSSSCGSFEPCSSRRARSRG